MTTEDRLKAAKIALENLLSQWIKEQADLTPDVTVARDNFNRTKNSIFKDPLANGVSSMHTVRKNIAAIKQQLNEIDQLLGTEGNETSSTMSF